MNKNNRREQLFKAAFKLFLTKHYDSVSIADIEKEAGMTRGAIPYYAKNKLGLFRAVVQHYLIDKQNLINKVHDTPQSLKEFIDAYLQGVSQSMRSMQETINDLTPQNASRSYLSLLLQLREMVPELHDEFIQNRNNELSRWNMVLQRAAISGEIREGLDIMALAEQFVYLFYGLSFYESMQSGLDVEHLRYQYNNLYRLICAK